MLSFIYIKIRGGLFTGFRVESVKPPHEAELHLDGAEVVGAAFVLKKIVVVLGLVDLVLGVEVAEAHLGVKRQPLNNTFRFAAVRES